MAMARWKSPSSLPRGERTCPWTLTPPADRPAIVIRPGSPPNLGQVEG